MNYKMLCNYSSNLGSLYPKLCGNPLVAGQYSIPLSVLANYFPSESLSRQKVLDWGCGGGHFSYLLMEMGFDVYGYSYCLSDALYIMKEVLFKKFHREWHAVQSDCTDPVALPYPDAHFETAFSLGVLEHVRENQGGDEVSSLRELYRILKPGGHLFVFHFPNKHSWIEKCVRILNKMRIVTAYSHSFLYTQQTIEHLVGQTNFSLLEMGMYNLFPRRMLRWVPRGIANKKCVFTGVCFAERFVERWLRKFSQNYYFVLKKL